MAEPEEIPALRLKAIELLETALKVTEETGDETSVFLIERALDQMRADAWPDAMMTRPRRISRKRRLIVGPKEFRGIRPEIIAPCTNAEIVPMEACGIKKHGAGTMPQSRQRGVACNAYDYANKGHMLNLEGIMASTSLELGILIVIAALGHDRAFHGRSARSMRCAFACSEVSLGRKRET